MISYKGITGIALILMITLWGGNPAKAVEGIPHTWERIAMFTHVYLASQALASACVCELCV